MNKNIIRGSLELAGFNNHLYGTNTDGECIHLAVLGSEFDMYFDDDSGTWEKWTGDINDEAETCEFEDAYEFALVNSKE